MPPKDSPESPRPKDCLPKASLVCESKEDLEIRKQQLFAQSEIIDPEQTLQFPEEEKKYLDIKIINQEALSAASFAILNALDFIRGNSRIMEELKRRDITLREPAYYLSIAIKETTSLAPDKIGNKGNKDVNSWAYGYFQLKKVALDSVNKNFCTCYEIEDIYSSDPPNSCDQMRDSTNNAIAGILFWHLCERKVQRELISRIDPKDKDKITAMIYFMGSGNFTDLYEVAGKPRTFDQLAKFIAQHLDKQFSFLTPFTSGFTTSYDNAQGVETKVYLESGNLSSGEVISKLYGKTITIKGKKFNAQNLFVSIQYGEIVDGMINKESLAQPNYRPYIVAKGDTPEKIVGYALDQYGMGVKDSAFMTQVSFAIMAVANANGHYRNLQAGKKIMVPSKDLVIDILTRAGLIYMVEEGDSFSKISGIIARKYGIPYSSNMAEAMMSFNKKIRGRTGRLLFPGKPVFIPPKSELQKTKK